MGETPRFEDGWPAPVEMVNADGRSPFVLIGDHASNFIPAEYGRLGLTTADLQRHIAYDIGVSAVIRRLAAVLDAPAFLGTVSRLVVDLNRPFGAPTSVPTLSEDTAVPGNRDLAPDEVARRRERVFEPFHAAVRAHLDRRDARPTILVAVHSFTPVFLGVRRPWDVGVLHEGAPFARALLDALRADPALVVGENEPYRIERGVGDYAVPVHGTDRGLPAVLVEIRNDRIADEGRAQAWGERLAACLRAAADRSLPVLPPSPDRTSAHG